MKFIKLPKEKTFIRKKYWSGSFSLPLELKTLPKPIYDELLNYLHTAVSQRLKDGKIRTLRIEHISFSYTTVKTECEGVVKP